MVVTSDATIRRRLTEWVDAFEEARASADERPLSAFLPPRSEPEYFAVLAELVRIEIEQSWRCGTRRRLDEHLRQFPEIASAPAVLSAVAFEEYRQRILCGEAAAPNEYASQYRVNVADWPPVGAAPGFERPSLLATESLAVEPSGQSITSVGGSPSVQLSEVQVGQTIAGFELMAEMGRGAFSKVFLARQAALAGRQVVVKVAEQFPGESQALAQLQHTNIVPIFSQHRAGALHLICMPFLGCATLADVLRELRADGPLPRSGEGLVSTIKESASGARGGMENSRQQGFSAVENQRASPSERSLGHWHRLRKYSYVEAVLWLVARLASGLKHAHERGILHRDLKPANVLLRDDGEPMLLDFNLSASSRGVTLRNAGVLGGTLAYMAPEQIRALQGEQVSVDAQADVFSLGVMLYELLTGRLPFAAPQREPEFDLATALELRRSPPPISGLNSQVPRAVRSIVRRCLAEEPGRRFLTAGDLLEDLQRQLNHLPLRHARDRSLAERCGKWRRRHPRATSAGAVAMLAAVVLAIVSSFWWSAERRVAAERARDSLHAFVDDSIEAQFLLAAGDPSSPQRAQGREAAVRALSEVSRSHEDSAKSGFELLNDRERTRLESEITELRAALAADELRDVKGNSQLGDESSPELAAGSAVQDRVAYARRLIARSRFSEAVELLKGATREQPQQVRYWALLGRAHEAQLNYEDAEACYTVCVVLKPEWEQALVHRGSARYRQRDFAGAADDFDAAVAIAPSSTDALVNRALARQQLGRLEEAIGDLNRAIDLEPDRARFYYLRARLHRRDGEIELASRDERKANSCQPKDAEGWVVRGVHQLPNDPDAALAAFDAALELYPRSMEALRNKAHVLAERLGQPEAAIGVLTQAIDVYPRCAPAILGRGVLRARLGEREAAHADAQLALTLDTGPEAHYQAACIYAQTARDMPADAHKAIHLLFAAVHLGFDRALASRDPDLTPIRNHRDFARLVSSRPPIAKGK